MGSYRAGNYLNPIGSVYHAPNNDEDPFWELQQRRDQEEQQAADGSYVGGGGATSGGNNFGAYSEEDR